MSKKMKEEGSMGRPAIHQIAKAFLQGAGRPQSGERPPIEETMRVSDSHLTTLFRGSPNDPEALKWLDP